MTKQKDIHYKIFAADLERGETDLSTKREAKAYATKLKNLGFNVRVKKCSFANPNYDVIYSKVKRLRA